MTEKKDEETHESNSTTASKTENQQLIYETISTNACIACQRKENPGFIPLPPRLLLVSDV